MTSKEASMKQHRGDTLQIARKAFLQADYRSSQHFFQLAAKQSPNSIEPLIKLSACSAFLGSPRMARSHAISAVAAEENDPALFIELAEQLSLVGESEAAFRVIQRMQPEIEMPILSKARVAGVLHRIAKLEDSLNWIAQAASQVKNDSKHSSVHSFHGQLLRFHNRRVEADQAYEQAIKLDPQNTQSYLGRALVQRATPEHQHIDNLRRMLSRCKPNSRSEAHLAYALFKELDDLGDYAAAWPVLERGWRAKRSEKSYNAARETALFERLSALTTKLKSSDVASDETYPTPIFILGQPRSGSTLLERLLAQHADVEASGELFDFTHQLHWCADLSPQGFVAIEAADRVSSQDLSSLGQRYLEHIKWRANGKKYVIDKLPLNYLLTAFIAKAIPQAIIIHSIRDPMDGCYSQLKECFDHGYEHSYKPDDMAQHYLGYQNFMKRLKQDIPENFYDCHHSQMVSDPHTSTEKLFAYCKLDFKPEYLSIEKDQRPVSTASSSQVRSKINSEGIGRWQVYSDHLSSMREKLGV